MEYYITQGIGAIGMALIVASFQLRDQRNIKTVQCVAAIFFVAHYSMLGAYTGAAMNCIAAARSFVFSNRSRYRWASSILWFWGFIAAVFAAGVFTWQGPVSIFLIVAMVFSNLSVWNRDTFKVRMFWLPSCLLFMAYNLCVGSYPGFLTEVFVMCSIMVALCRYNLFPWLKARKANN